MFTQYIYNIYNIQYVYNVYIYKYIYIHVHIAKHTQAFSRAKRGGQLPLYDDCGVSFFDSDCLVMFIHRKPWFIWLIYFHSLRSSNMAIEHPLYFHAGL